MNENICLSLDNLNSLTKILLTKRSQRHALEIDSQEPNLKINQNGKVNKIVLPKHYFSNQMIEEAMLSANICAIKDSHCTHDKRERLNQSIMLKRRAFSQ